MDSISLMIEDRLRESDNHLAVQNQEWFKKLQGQVDDLLRNDFPALVQILYQCDISERKLKLLLKENTEYPAAHIIAALLVERHVKKMEVRKQFLGTNVAESQEERW